MIADKRLVWTVMWGFSHEDFDMRILTIDCRRKCNPEVKKDLKDFSYLRQHFTSWRPCMLICQTNFGPHAQYYIWCIMHQFQTGKTSLMIKKPMKNEVLWLIMIFSCCVLVAVSLNIHKIFSRQFWFFPESPKLVHQPISSPAEEEAQSGIKDKW